MADLAGTTALEPDHDTARSVRWWSGSIPSGQLQADTAARCNFSNVLDLLPFDEQPFLLPVHPTDTPLTYAALRRFLLHARSMLVGLAVGDRVGLALPNGPALATCFIVLPALGLTLCPLNPELSVEEMAFELSDLPAAALIVPALQHGASSARAAAAALSVRLIELEPDPTACGLFRASWSTPAAAAAAAGALPPTWQPGRDDVCLVMHTSGTTRRPSNTGGIRTNADWLVRRLRCWLA